MSSVVPVLLYHRISSDKGADPFAVAPRVFDEHVRAIAASGRTPLTVTELAAALKGETSLPEPAVVITFDDGYADTLAATERLGDRRLRSTVYVTTGLLDRADGIPRSHLTALSDCDHVELGAHTVSHPRLDELPRRWRDDEIRGSKETLEQTIGQAVTSFAYPHGSHDARCRQSVIEAGFSSAAAVKNALSHTADDPWAIARWTVTARTSTAQLERVLGGAGIPLAWAGERLRTRAFRMVRRGRRAVRTRQPV